MSAIEENNKQFISRYLKSVSGKPKTADMLPVFISEGDMELFNHIIATERSFPSYEMIPQDMIAENDKVTVRFLFRGKGNQNSYFNMNVKNKVVSMNGIIIYQVKNEKIINHWVVCDNLGMMQQLGILPVDEKQDIEMTHLNVIYSNKDKI